MIMPLLPSGGSFFHSFTLRLVNGGCEATRESCEPGTDQLPCRLNYDVRFKVPLCSIIGWMGEFRPTAAHTVIGFHPIDP
jgi:hypothetical protein